MTSPSSTVVTRFAPSPTGYLHIGGARTALFNWLYAKSRGGKFLIRVEDTDRERSTDDAVKAIFDGLSWLELFGDEEPVFQFARADRHREVAEQLLAAGHAYRDFLSADETNALRDAAKAEGRDFVSPWRDREPTVDDLAKPSTIRFRRPLDQAVVVDDAVQGSVRWESSSLDDLVIVRSDGAPTYNLAVVVDDHDMGVTHVIRGDDHLNNAARQSLIYDALGWTRPTFAHIPLIHGPDGAKLSKRHGAQAVHEYAEMGYLPEAMRNYLARLGWAHGDHELFSDEQAIEWFDLPGIGKAPARLDFDKLAHVNAHWIRLAEDDRLAKLTLDAHLSKGRALQPDDEARLMRAMPFVKDRAKTIVELASQTEFVLKARPLALDEKTRGLLTGEGGERISRLRERLRLFQSWDVFALEAELKAFAEEEGVGFGKIGPSMRGTLTGGSVSPDIARILAALGRDEGLGRLDDALQQTK
ncbi:MULTISPECIES: glutamate--tRNA ligase [unclassified Brevundimonas]|uniref:glutamate--tRNA ligase n=1 Tax=unclassified Brevundimonas TaxID=2622653 RepID=UPI000CFB0AEC|nr:MULTISPECIES: glutamate--tRNA ligase [unclassified Brevundimonas]PRA31960.1 glutamate--tRNA ligase [Brevundimonas sp. MYb27]PQZ82701.1 glutamate--tRNA ligase [Brevundimonas sp. MYb31]PRB17098.1 glutamate--tRNA ligase [Brevundimonas sp. MYb52]PRB37272.1 glutamate--tRNA ligase [Brevundimonas sp. MYb46]PRB48440.1 glutamate--tRNA ligase [Brevundimonas sp. MYb33]